MLRNVFSFILAPKEFRFSPLLFTASYTVPSLLIPGLLYSWLLSSVQLVGTKREKRRSKKIKKKLREESRRAIFIFSRAVFRAAPQLTERQKEATLL